MARIAGLDLPKEKRIDIALAYIYGIGRALAKKILQDMEMDGSIRVKNLTEVEISKLNTYISKSLKVEGELRREVQSNIKTLVDLGTYRGMRHRRAMPVRGQRTKTNARTKRGKRRTVGAVKAEAKAAKEAKNK